MSEHVTMPSNVDVVVSPPLLALYQCSRLPCARVRLGPVSHSDCAWRFGRQGRDWNIRHDSEVESWGKSRRNLKVESHLKPGAH